MAQSCYLAKYVVLVLFTLFFRSSYSSLHGLSLKMIRRDSSKSVSERERVEGMVGLSQARAGGGFPKGHVFYSVQVLLGTPPVAVNLEMDSGNDLTWAQCMPCKPCFPQTSPIYDPRNSSTFQKLPCTHSLCNSTIL